MTKEYLWEGFEFSLNNPWLQSVDEKRCMKQSSPDNSVTEDKPIQAKVMAYPKTLTIHFGTYLDKKKKNMQGNMGLRTKFRETSFFRPTGLIQQSWGGSGSDQFYAVCVKEAPQVFSLKQSKRTPKEKLSTLVPCAAQRHDKKAFSIQVAGLEEAEHNNVRTQPKAFSLPPWLSGM